MSELHRYLDIMYTPSLGCTLTLDAIQGCSVFTKLDLKSAFNLLQVAAGDEWKTAFHTNEGLFEYLVIPFGLTNAPAAFQSFIQWVLWEFLDIICVVYLDGILIFLQTQEAHDAPVLQILSTLNWHGLLTSANKCEFDKGSLEYLGFILGKDGVAMHPNKLSTIADWPEPCSVKDIQHFLGLANFYCHFISHFASIAGPLYELTHKDAPIPFKLTDDAHNAVSVLKLAFQTAPILIHHDPSKPVFLFTDASDFAISGIPHQADSKGDLHLLCFFSWKLTDAEINYDVHDKEMLGVIESLKEFRPWLSGTVISVSVITDHKNLEYFMTSWWLNHFQAQWSLELAEFNFKLLWTPGSKNPADGPSRHPDFVPQEGDAIKDVNLQMMLGDAHTEHIHSNSNSASSKPIPTSHPSFLIAATLQLVDNGTLIEEFKLALALDLSWEEASEWESKDIWRWHKNWSKMDDFVLFRDKIYVPPLLCLKTLFEHHDTPLAGHPGWAKTIELITWDYSWPGLSQDVQHYVRSCDLCQQNKAARHAPYGNLNPLEIPTQNWDSISMDFIMDLLPSHGFDTLLVVVDWLSKQSHFLPMIWSLNVPGLAQLYISTIFKLHRLPSSIISDWDPLFTSLFWDSLTSWLGIQLKLSMAYHPQTDGQMEWVNQCIEQYLQNFCSYQQDDWVVWLLGLAEFHYNNLIHNSTHVSPFYANYGFNPSFSIPCLHQLLTPATSDFLSHLSTIHSELMAELKLVQELAKLKYDAHWAPAPMFNNGNLVMLSCWNIKMMHLSNKFDYQKLGPFKVIVINQIGSNAYQLELPESLSQLHPIFNINLLEPYTLPSSFSDCVQQLDPILEVVLETENALKLKEIMDVQKVGCHFDYLAEFLDKPVSECSWIPLSDIPNNYDKLLEQFHHCHTSRPRPSANTFKAKSWNPIDNPTSVTNTTPSPSIPSTSTLPPHDPLAHIPCPTSPLDPNCFTYQLPSVMTTHSKCKSQPHNLDLITESIMSNTPQQSLAP